MKLQEQYKGLQLSRDQENALDKLQAFLDGDLQLFMLKGYAGSGKTTLVKGIASYLEGISRPLKVMAPTGRAAKVLRDKTGKGITVHKGIYDMTKIESREVSSEDVSRKSYHYYFPTREIEASNSVLIIDESSMISDVKQEQELFTFGTGKLLSDLLTYAKLATTDTKIIFVGDPAQLPPVTDTHSYALDREFFAGMRIGFIEVEMTEVIRQAEESTILKNATVLRETLAASPRNQLQLTINDTDCINIAPQDIPSRFLQLFPAPEIGQSVIISYKNQQCKSYNDAVREQLFPGKKRVCPGDLLMIINNNYHKYGVALFNGDLAKVIRVDDQTTVMSAPVMVNFEGKTVKKNISLTYRDIVIRVPHHPEDIHCKIIDSLLDDPKRDLTVDEMKAVYINFVMRFNEEQKGRKERGLPVFSEGSDEFKQQLRDDPYFNALRVKYGYAVTCHKAQGGEWETAFIDFFGMAGLKDAQLRWCYTAITRASKTAYLSSVPHFTKFTKLQFNQPVKIGKVPADAIQYLNVPASPYHKESTHPCKSLKYFEIMEKFEDSPFVFEHIDSKDYLEIYYFRHEEQLIRIQANHDQAGIFREFQVMGTSTVEAQQLLEIINDPAPYDYAVQYTPSAEHLSMLFNIMQAVTSDLDISITNITENAKQNYVNYFLRTSGKVSYIQFYYSAKGYFTSALTFSDLGSDDEKLLLLIEKFNIYAG